MTKHYVLGLMAANRTGILAAVSTALAELGGNIRDIRLTVVENHFAMMLSADFPERRDPQVIVSHLEGVGRPFGLSVLLRDPAGDSLPALPSHESQVFQLTLAGPDRPGVLSRFSATLAREQVDIIDLYGWRNEPGTPMLMLELAVPVFVEVDRLREELHRLAAQYDLTCQLEFVTPGAQRDPRPLRQRLPGGGFER
ncbi:MAG: glycine cleavage system protein R [Planctomycetaceae bacterium]